MAALGGLIVLGSAVSLFVEPAPEPVVSEAERLKREMFLRDQTTEELGRRAVLAQLRDPSSARFGKSLGRLKYGKRVACGFVNAKNGFGGYTGETPWVMVVEDGIVMIRPSQGGRGFDKVWNRYCTGDADTEEPAAHLG